MKTYLTIIIGLVVSCVQAQSGDTTRREIVLLNNQEIPTENLFLINPKKIKSIHVSYPTTYIKKYQIDTKEIHYYDYNDLKTRLHLKAKENPEVYVDERNYPNRNNLQVDKSFIKRLNYVNGTIRIVTRTKRTKMMSPCRGVITKTYSN